MATETIFLICFIAFIVGILILDMCVIDKKAHEVSLKEATIWTFVWIGLSLLFAGFLYIKGDLVHGIDNLEELNHVINEYKIEMPDDIKALAFPEQLDWYRHSMTMTYITGYLIEKMLSVDNLFVMMMIFSAFKVSKIEYQRVLNWGIMGAIVLRCLFIFIGAAAIKQFDWLLYIFGGFLIYSAVKTFFQKDDDDEELPGIVTYLSKHLRVFPRFNGDDFFVHATKNGDEFTVVDKAVQGAKLFITPLFLAMVSIEFCDVIFAFDSIPAIFSVSLDPYIVFFSNIFAILGLRAMFFLLAAIADKFRFLQQGVSILLLFIGVKLLCHSFFHIPDWVSLVFILGVLTLSIVLSLAIPAPKEEEKE